MSIQPKRLCRYSDCQQKENFVQIVLQVEFLHLALYCGTLKTFSQYLLLTNRIDVNPKLPTHVWRPIQGSSECASPYHTEWRA